MNSNGAIREDSSENESMNNSSELQCTATCVDASNSSTDSSNGTNSSLIAGFEGASVNDQCNLQAIQKTSLNTVELNDSVESDDSRFSTHNNTSVSSTSQSNDNECVIDSTPLHQNTSATKQQNLSKTFGSCVETPFQYLQQIEHTDSPCEGASNVILETTVTGAEETVKSDVDSNGKIKTSALSETNDEASSSHLAVDQQPNATPASDDSTESANEIDSDLENILRRRFARRVLSDLSDDSNSVGVSDDGRHSSVDEDSDGSVAHSVEADTQSVVTDLWPHLINLRHREIGYNSRTVLSHTFETKCCASLSFLKRFECAKKLDYHQGCVNALHFNKSGTLLASGSDDLQIAVWDWNRRSPYFVFESGHRSNVFQCKFIPFTGDSHIVTCARDGQVRLAELSSTGVCKGTKKLAQHRGAAHKLALLEDSSHEIYSCGEDAVVYQVDLRQEKPQKLCTTKEKQCKIPLYSIHANPFKTYEFCTGGRDQFIRVYDKRMVGNAEGDGGDGCMVKKYSPHHLTDSSSKANVTCAVYNWNGTEILGSYNDEDIYMFDNQMSDGAQYIHKYCGHRNNATIKSVNYYGPHSEYIVSGSDCGNVFLWERDSELIVNYMAGDSGGVVNVLEPHPHLPLLATSGLDNDVKLFLPTAQQSTELKGLSKRVKKNSRAREDERSSEPDMMDGRMLWYLMNRLRRTRQARDGGDGAGDDAVDSDDDSDDDSDNDSHQSADGAPVECMPS